MNSKIICGILALALGLTGCGNQGQDATELLTKAQETMGAVESMTAKMTMDMAMKTGEEAFSAVTTAEIVSFTDPVKMKIDVSSAMNEGESQSTVMETYMMETDGIYTAYMNMGTGWYSAVVDEKELMQYNAGENIDLYLQNLVEGKIISTKDHNGTTVSIIEGTVSGEAMNTVLESTGAIGSPESMGITAEEIQEMYDTIGSVGITLSISDEGYVYEYDMDMTNLMQMVMDKTMAAFATEDTETGITIEKAAIRMICDDFNSAEEFTVPEEALNSQISQ